MSSYRLVDITTRGTRLTSRPRSSPPAGLIAVREDRVALLGGNSGLFDRLVLCELGDSIVERPSTWQLVLPGGDVLPAGSWMEARVRYIHVLSSTPGSDWTWQHSSSEDLRVSSWTLVPCVCQFVDARSLSEARRRAGGVMSPGQRENEQRLLLRAPELLKEFDTPPRRSRQHGRPRDTHRRACNEHAR